VDEQLELPEPLEPTEPAEPAEPSDDHDEAVLAIAARHALHDEELVAGLAAAALEPDEAGRVRAVVDRCVVCRDLHADLVATAAAHRATAVMTLAAPRDFRLTEGDALRIRPDLLLIRPPAVASSLPDAPTSDAPAPSTSLPERLRSAFWGAAKPLGGALAAAGLVGVLIGSVNLVGMPAGGALVPAGDDRQGISAPEPTGAAEVDFGDATNGEAARLVAVDSRLLVLAVSLGLGLTGLLLLALARRRARESI